MAEPADDVQGPEITLDDFDGDEQVATPAPSADKPAAKADDKPEVKDAKPAADGDDTPPADPAPPTDDDKPDEGEPKDGEEEPEDKPTKGEQRKEQLNTEIRDLVSQRNSLRSDVEKMTGEAYQVATEKDLAGEINPDTGEAYTTVEAKLEAMRQEQAMSKYNAEVTDKQLVLGQESFRVMNDFPIFNPASEDYDAELSKEAAELLEANLIRDPNVPETDPATGKPTGLGMIIGSNMSPYRLYQTLARASGISATRGQIKGQKATEQQLANVDSPSSASPPKKKADPLMALWESDD